ncbi:MAG: hypothetical protein WCC57_11965 [Paracoccaceae bacterium]
MAMDLLYLTLLAAPLSMVPFLRPNRLSVLRSVCPHTASAAPMVH